MSDFVHLHCHSEYSLLDGAIRLKDLVGRAGEYDMSAAAITDHGNMFGAATFYSMAKSAGVKPIIGCEVYVTEGHRTNTENSPARYHLVLLAQNLTGYRNLLHIVSQGWINGFYYKPRVDKELLAARSEGLIALSACLAGEVPRKLLRESMDAGVAAARDYARIFPDRFYLELQANGMEEQFQANEKLIELAGHLKLPLVATNDCHYLDKTDVEAHDILLCIQTAAQVDETSRMRFSTNELYYRPPEEMEREFAHVPEAVSNTAVIAERCDLDLDLKTNHFPVYDLPEGMTLEDEFRELSRRGLKERLAKLPYEVDERKYWERLDYELDIICRMEFPGYFLIVQDFINWAKAERIPVGPGRGSAAGSLVAFALKITNIDPLPYDLLFERFLNVERVSMPDIDVDFCERRRSEVIQYVTEKYGADNVAQITTFGTMKAKAAVRDVGRALGMSFSEVNRIAKLIPDELKMTIDKALEREQDLRELMELDPQVRKLLDVSRRLEGLCRHASTHAAGVVISPRPMDEFCPLYKDKKGGIVTQFDMKRVEKVGLIKFDFLGLRTMTVIQDTLDNIAAGGGDRPDLDSLPLSDEKTYELYSRGDTDGIFQVESSGMRRYLQMLKPNCFEDIIAMLALYRPGPLGSGMVDEFIKRKHGEVPVTYPHPSLEETLKPTYGVIVYQEQVMAIAMIMGGYSLGQGDLLRRAMGKKIVEEMARQRVSFLAGAREKGIDEQTAAEVFDLMEKFASYGFNKSHSAAYALISYHTAYLKTHYPREFMAALMTSELENHDKIQKYVNSCRDMNIRVEMPDVNRSLWKFAVEGRAVRYGLGAVKNVGEEAVKELVNVREKDGPFRSLLDLCLRVNLRRVNKRMLEALVKCGAMDCLGVTRAALLAGLDRVVGLAQKRQRERDSGQISMLGLLGGDVLETGPGLGVDCPEATLEEWPDEEKLGFEKEHLGFYLSSHPLLAYRQEIRRMRSQTLEECAECGPESEVRVACIVTGLKEHVSAKGKMAFCQVEDLTDSGELIVFASTYAEHKELLAGDKPLLISGRIGKDKRDDGESGEGDEPVKRKAKILADEIRLLSECIAVNDEPVNLSLVCDAVDRNRLASLREILSRYPGRAEVILELVTGEARCRLKFGQMHNVCPSPDFWRDIEQWRRVCTSVALDARD